VLCHHRAEPAKSLVPVKIHEIVVVARAKIIAAQWTIKLEVLKVVIYEIGYIAVYDVDHIG